MLLFKLAENVDTEVFTVLVNYLDVVSIDTEAE